MEAEEKTDNLKAIRDVSFFMGIYLLFSGWIYIYYFLDFFGISIREADIDFSQFVIYSYSVLAYYGNKLIAIQPKTFLYWSEIILSGLILIKSYFLLADLFEKIRLRHKLFLIILLLFFFFPLVFMVSKNAGVKTARQGSLDPHSDFKSITFIFNESFLKQDSCDMKCENDTMRNNNFLEKERLIRLNKLSGFKLIMNNKDKYYVVYHPANCPSCVPNVYSINKENIYAVEIMYNDHAYKRIME